MSRASPLPRSGDRSKAVMVGVIAGVMVISPLLDVSLSAGYALFTAHLPDVRDGPKSTSLNYFFARSQRSGKSVSRTKPSRQKVGINSNCRARKARSSGETARAHRALIHDRRPAITCEAT